MALKAYCYASGLIEITNGKMPDGTLPLGVSPKIRELISARARWSYPQRDKNKKPIPGTSVPLVPGIPETTDEDEKYDAYVRFKTWLEPDLAPREASA